MNNVIFLGEESCSDSGTENLCEAAMESYKHCEDLTVSKNNCTLHFPPLVLRCPPVEPELSGVWSVSNSIVTINACPEGKYFENELIIKTDEATKVKPGDRNG